jgi:RHS repeat-associated protein
VYGPGGGKLALMSGQTLAKGFVPLSGGATAVYNSNGLAYYRHADWLGSSRFASLPSGTSRLYYDGAYAPYGENYAEAGTIDRSFTGQNQDTVNSGAYPLYDFLYRQHHPVWGRWLSPDPAGLGAVDPTNPQSLNRYAYVLNNPMTLIDPLGLQEKSNLKLQAAPQSSGCTLNGIYTACSVVYSLLGAGAAGNTTGIDTSPVSGPNGWSFYGCYADGSCGFVPASLAGLSPLDISNALAMIAAAAPAVGSPIKPDALTGSAASLYAYLVNTLGISRADITVYSDADGHLSVVLSQTALAAVRQDLISHYLDLTGVFHRGYTEGARDAKVTNSLHAVWTDPRLSAYFGIPGVYAQLHYDAWNPFGGIGPFWKHAVCALFSVGCQP